MGAMPLRYPLHSPKLREQNWAGPLRYPLRFAEVEGAEPGEALFGMEPCVDSFQWIITG